MGFPIYFTEIQPASTDFVQSGAGSVQAIPATAYYFMITGKTTAGNGRSFLNLLSALLTASSGGTVTWTVTLTSAFKVRFVHNSGGAVNLTLDAGLASQLGLAIGYNPGFSTGLSIPAGAGGATFNYPPVWLWTPDMWISTVGPQFFDPMTCSGIKSSAGTASRSPDQTASFVDNGTQVEAVHMFNGVAPYYKAYSVDTDTLHQREDFNTWWWWGPRLGRRILYWKTRSQVIGVTSFALGGEGSAADYYVYYPQPSLHAAPTIVAAAPPHLVYWNVTIALWQTEQIEGNYGT